jgi:hypothetical protein
MYLLNGLGRVNQGVEVDFADSGACSTTISCTEQMNKSGLQLSLSEALTLPRYRYQHCVRLGYINVISLK